VSCSLAIKYFLELGVVGGVGVCVLACLVCGLSACAALTLGRLPARLCFHISCAGWFAGAVGPLVLRHEILDILIHVYAVA
jgi:hypothetical protein